MEPFDFNRRFKSRTFPLYFDDHQVKDSFVFNSLVRSGNLAAAMQPIPKKEVWYRDGHIILMF